MWSRSGTIENIMLLDRINPFGRYITAKDLARRASIESPVQLVGIRHVSEHETFGLAGASPATIRRSCWPVHADFREPVGEARCEPESRLAPGGNAAGSDAPELQRALAQVAANMALPEHLDTNLGRLDLIRDHYRAVVAGEARLADVDFTTTTMRPFVTWLRALEKLADKKYGRCGSCAEKLQCVVVADDFGGHFTVRQLGTIDKLAPRLDPHATAACMLDKIEPLLRDFHRAIGHEGAGSAALESRIERLGGSAAACPPALGESFGYGVHAVRAVHNPLYGVSGQAVGCPRTSRDLADGTRYPSLASRSMSNLSVSDSQTGLSRHSLSSSTTGLLR